MWMQHWTIDGVDTVWMTDEAPLVGRWVGPVPFSPVAALDQFAETLPSAHGVAELFNFLVLLLQQLRAGLL